MSALPRKIGSYQVKERLEGHDREVYLATRPAEKANRRYVLAFFDLADDAVEDFEAEVMRTMELDHPQLTRAVELLVHDGRQVIAYEGVPGASLITLEGHLRAQGQGLGDGAALYIVHEICVALTAAHMATDLEGKPVPLVHAQLGPHQVFLSWDGEVKLLGIGLSTIFRLAAGVSAVPDEVASYIAPEVRKGGALTVRANLYTVAALAWSLLTAEALPERPEPLAGKRPDLDDRLTTLLDKALSPNLMKRTVTCSEIARVIFDAGLADAGELHGHMEELRAIETFELSTIGSESFPPSRLSEVPPESVPPILSVPPESAGFPKSESELLTLRPAPSSEPTSVEPSTVPRRPLPTRRQIPAPREDEDKPIIRKTIVGPPPAPTTGTGATASADEATATKAGGKKGPTKPALGIGLLGKRTPPKPKTADTKKANATANEELAKGAGATKVPPKKAAPEQALAAKAPAKVEAPVRPTSAAEPDAPEPDAAEPDAAGPKPSATTSGPKKTLMLGVIPQNDLEATLPGADGGSAEGAAVERNAARGSDEPGPSTKSSASLAFPDPPEATNAAAQPASTRSPSSDDTPGALSKSAIAAEPSPSLPSESPAGPGRRVIPFVATGVLMFGLGVGVGRMTAPGATPSAYPPSTTSGPSDPEVTAEPIATTAASARLDPSTAPSAVASASASADAIPPNRARLVITTVYPDAHVYMGGNYVGPVGEPLEVDCGIVNIRLGTKPLKRWHDEGRAVDVKCGEVNEVTIAPDPDPYPYE